MTEVLVLTQFSELGGASRIQALQLIPYLEKESIRCRALHFYSDGFYRVQMGTVQSGKLKKSIGFFLGQISAILMEMYCIFVARKYDVIYIQRQVFPRSLYWLLRKMNPKIVYEIEDTIYEINPHLKQSYLHLKALQYQAKLCLNMMQYARWIVAENTYLRDEAIRHNTNVSIMTCPIDTERLKPGQKVTGKTITLGWIGSPSTTRLLGNLGPVFETLGEKYGSRIRLVTVGAKPDFYIDGMSYIKKPWSLASEVSDMQLFDIGLMPLDDDPFNRGRLGGKMIQYLCVGIPTVADNIGLNASVIDEGSTGFLVNNHQEWVEKISYLVEHEDVRIRMGRAGRQVAEEKYEIVNQAKFLANIFHNL